METVKALDKSIGQASYLRQVANDLEHDGMTETAKDYRDAADTIAELQKIVLNKVDN